MTEPMFLDKSAAADTAGVSVDTLDRAIKAGKLKAKKTGLDADGNATGKVLVSRKALEDWFEQLADA